MKQQQINSKSNQTNCLTDCSQKWTQNWGFHRFGQLWFRVYDYDGYAGHVNLVNDDDDFEDDNDCKDDNDCNHDDDDDDDEVGVV